MTTQRQEPDTPEILSGVYDGRTTGTPIAVLIRNSGQRSRDYDALAAVYRPGHADATYDLKYGHRDPRGGGRASARETVARVAAGAIARKLLTVAEGVEILAYTIEIDGVRAAVDPERVTRDEIERWGSDQNPVRCPAPDRVQSMIDRVEAARRDQDSVGGVAEIVVRGAPAGLGEPVFSRLKAELGHALFSIPAVTGVEFGQGFEAARMRGSAHNDPIRGIGPKGLDTASNHQAGNLGGISSGTSIVIRAAVKPTSSIAKEQKTISAIGQPETLRVKGRHDPCLLPRFCPVAEAMVALRLADLWLMQRARLGPLAPLRAPTKPGTSV